MPGSRTNTPSHNRTSQNLQVILNMPGPMTEMQKKAKKEKERYYGYILLARNFVETREDTLLSFEWPPQGRPPARLSPPPEEAEQPTWPVPPSFVDGMYITDNET